MVHVRLGATAMKMIQRIKNAPASRLGYIGTVLYKIGKGEVSVREPLEKDGWREVWRKARQQ